MMSTLMDVPAPAKLNLFLHVVGRRADGFHGLQTVFRFIDLADTLHFERRADGRIRRVSSLPGVPSENCLTVRAAAALQQATGVPWGVDIHLHKRIPQGGGLGGGSSDAASVLLALNRLWQTRLSRVQLQRLALPLGADVPVFVFGQNAFAEGVGEILAPVTLPDNWYVVVQPAVAVATAAVFAHPDLTRNTKPVKILDFPWCGSGGNSQVLDSGFGPGAVWQYGHNDLAPVVRAQYPQVEVAWQVADQALRSLQAPDCRVQMSGSGACLFIESASQQQAASIQAQIAATIRSSNSAASAITAVHLCAGLSSHPLQQWTE